MPSINFILFFSRLNSSRRRQDSKSYIRTILLSIRFSFLKLMNISKFLIMDTYLWARLSISICFSHSYFFWATSLEALTSSSPMLFSPLSSWSLWRLYGSASFLARSKLPFLWSFTQSIISDKLSTFISLFTLSLSFSLKEKPSSFWRKFNFVNIWAR